MKDLLDKISSYNLFTCLFPGVLFVVILEQISKYSLQQDNLVVGVFFYYFIGLIISRLGSLVVEPILKKISFIQYTNYKDFVDSSKKDEKINILLEINNTYRTIIALLLAVLLIKPYEILHQYCPDYIHFISIGLLLILFLWAYKKQTKYILKRIDCNKE